MPVRIIRTAVMKLSVVIVNYNVSHYLLQCVDSLSHALRGIDSEVIVVDNHSRDNSIALLRHHHPEVRIVENRAGKATTLIYKKYQLVGMHTGRRSFATNMYKRRFPTIAIMRLTGHTTEANFLKYIKVTPEENAAMMAEEFFKMMKPFEDD